MHDRGARRCSSSNVRLGTNVSVGIGTVLGGDPQDLKFKGEETWVEIGDGTRIREYITVNRGTAQSFKTTVGKGCFLMSYVHLAHDCHVGDGVIISNATQLAGHVTIEDRAILSGLSAVHQFVKIGRHSFVGGCSRVAKDVPPFIKAVGNPVKLYGLNSVGLQRSGFPDEVVRELKRAYRLFFRSELNVSQAMERARVGAAVASRSRVLPPVHRRESARGRVLTAPVRIGVIGAGALGYHHVRLLRDVEGATLVGFHESRDQSVRHRLRARSGVTAFASVEALIDACDALTIAVPTPAHYAVAKTALEKGQHLLIEKPLATSLAEADELLAIATRTGALIQMGHVERFNPRCAPRCRSLKRRASSKAIDSRCSTCADRMWLSCST